MKYASFFSGIGGFELALDAAGHKRVFSCEIDEFCNKVVKERFGHGHTEKDIRKVKASRVPKADLWVGGFPCQDLSVAGKRGGITARRSGLVWRMLKLAEVRKPRFILLENVPGLLNSKRGRDLGLLVRKMAELGYVGCYRVLDAQFTGVPQRRRRVFLAGYLGAECPLEVLFEPKGGSRNHQKGEKAWTVTAPRSSEEPGIVGCVSHLGGGGADDNEAQRGLLIAHPITKSGGHHGNSSDRGDGSSNLVVDKVAHCVSKSSGGSIGGRDGQDDYVIGPICAHNKKHGHSMGSGQAAEQGQIVATTLTAESRKKANSPGRRREDDTTIVTVIQDVRGARDNKQNGIGIHEGGPMFTVDATSRHGVSIAATIPSDRRVGSDGHADNLHEQKDGVRRLTPTECERLQGFPDGWTCLCGVRPDCPDRRTPLWVDPSTFQLGGCGHSACGCQCTDSARYRALGNTVAIPEVRWIADRLPV